MKNELIAMETFLAVIDLRSFSAAARAVGVSQSTVSRRVRDLEAHLEVALLARTTREVRPTGAGLRYAEAVRGAVAAVGAARSAARTRAEALSGTLRVGCSSLFGEAWLAPRLSPWLARHPELRLELQLRGDFVDLVAAGLDLAIRFGGPPSAELRGRRLRSYARVLLASPAWVARHGEPRTPADLLETRALMYGGADAREWVLRRGDERVTVRPTWSVGATAGGVLDTLARHDVGPVLAPEWLAVPRLARGELVRILPEWEGSPMALWVVRPNHAFVSAATRSFSAWVTEAVLADEGLG